MCKNTKDVQCKKQLHVDGNLLFSHPCGLTGQHPDSMRDRKRLFDLLFSESFWICWVSQHCLRVNISSAPLTCHGAELTSVLQCFRETWPTQKCLTTVKLQ